MASACEAVLQRCSRRSPPSALPPLSFLPAAKKRQHVGEAAPRKTTQVVIACYPAPNRRPRMRFIPFVLVFLTSAAAAEAQQAGPGVESVTVTGTHERQMLQSFVQSSAAPARITGKLVRWDQGICPIVKGAPQAFAERIIARLKAVALSVGAPVSSDPKCAPNIQIAVTGK